MMSERISSQRYLNWYARALKAAWDEDLVCSAYVKDAGLTAYLKDFEI